MDLMDNMLLLLGSDKGGYLFVHIFLHQFLSPVHRTLVNSPCLADRNRLAEEAVQFTLCGLPRDNVGMASVYSTDNVSKHNVD